AQGDGSNVTGSDWRATSWLAWFWLASASWADQQGSQQPTLHAVTSPAPDSAADRGAALRALEAEIVECRACPRLVAWREHVANEKRAAFRAEEYWGRPVPGFGDPDASVAVVGLAPAA